LAWLERNFSALLLQPKRAGHLPTNEQIVVFRTNDMANLVRHVHRGILKSDKI
jgi:hypothetical protein